MPEKVDWNQLVAALREELQEKGGLVRLLDQQAQALFQRDAPENERLEEQIRIQLRAIERCTEVRELKLRQSVTSFQLREDVQVSQVIENFPEYVHPLLEALVIEVDRLSSRMQESMLQNEGLKQRFIVQNTLEDQKSTGPTY
jgi:hypothetical protein